MGERDIRTLFVFLPAFALVLVGCTGLPSTATVPPPAPPQDECQVEPQPLSCAADADARAVRPR